MLSQINVLVPIVLFQSVQINLLVPIVLSQSVQFFNVINIESFPINYALILDYHHLSNIT